MRHFHRTYRTFVDERGVTAASELGQQWAAERQNELDAGTIDAIVQALTVHAAPCDAARRCLDSFERNRVRMRSPEFEAEGLCPSTGGVESGCTVTIGHRLKRSAMPWGLRGTNAISALQPAQRSLRGRLSTTRPGQPGCVMRFASRSCRAPERRTVPRAGHL